MTSRQRPNAPSLLQIAAVVVVLIAISISWITSRRQGQDFGYLYAASVGIATGAPIYDTQWQKAAFERWGLPLPQGVFYPPATGFASLPFAMLPYSLAEFLWFVILVTAVLLGVQRLVRLGRPDARRSTVALAAGLVLMSACVRWGITPLQGAPLILGLLCFLIVGLHSNRPIMVFMVALFATTFKFTIALPFLGLLLLHECYAALLGSVMISGVLNILGFIRVGGLTALRDYRGGIVTLESLGTVNTPNPWDPQSSPRLDWTYLFTGIIGNVPISRILAVVFSGLILAWLFLESRRIYRPVNLTTTAAFLVPLVCVGVLSVYHHHYDISPIIAPLLVLGTRFPDPKLFRRAWAWWLLAPQVLMIATFPTATTQRLVVRLFGEHWIGLLNLTFPLTTTLTLVGSLVILHQIARSSKSSQTVS
jgi:hypothetical protein